MRSSRRIVPVVVSFILIAILVSYAPWAKVATAIGQLTFVSILELVALSLIYYALKSVRFWYLLRAMGIHKPLQIVALSYMSAQPVSLLPAGEIYRSHALRKYTGVPVKQSIGQFTLQGIFEGSSMALLILISSLALGRLRVAALLLTACLVCIIVSIQRGHLKALVKQFDKLPFLEVTDSTAESFSQRNQAALSYPWFPSLFAQSILIEIVGVVIAYTAVAGLGAHIDIFQATLLYTVPIIVGFVSFLPGGFGASEHSAVAILLLSHLTVGIAVAATLLMRTTIVILGVIYGLVVIGYSRLAYSSLGSGLGKKRD
jgi:uncharacterized protein (TIRG00374 family)